MGPLEIGNVNRKVRHITPINISLMIFSTLYFFVASYTYAAENPTYPEPDQIIEIAEQQGLKIPNDLVGKKLLIGKVKLKGIDLCRPCKNLQEILRQDNIIKEFLRKGGLRCEIINNGIIKLGDFIKV